MTAYIEDIAQLFGGISHQETTENFDFFKRRYKIIALNIPGDFENKLSNILERTSSRSLTVSLEIENQETAHITSSEYKNINTKVNEIRERISLVENNDKIFLEITVNKENSNYFDIFSMTGFWKYLSDLTMQEGYKLWSNCNQFPNIQVEIWESIESFSTNAISFSSVYPIQSTNTLQEKLNINRIELIEKRDKCSHFANAAQFDFVPYDFFLLSKCKDEKINKYFNGLFNAALIVYLADFSMIEKNTVKYKLKGYKLLSEDINFTELVDYDATELKEIFDWTYYEGNYIDKIGLARNIISIHLRNESLLSLESGVSSSVESSYDLYLKENVKQYIDIKNKISEFLQSQSDKASDITKNMFSMFKTGLWTFTTFFISVFLLRVVNSKAFSGSISFEVLIVCILLIIFSLIYLIVSIFELNADRNRLLDKYTEIRNRYKDLLNVNDLDKILNEELTKKKEERFINSKRNAYTITWLLTNFLILITVLFLYFQFQGNDHTDTDIVDSTIKEDVSSKEIESQTEPELKN